MSEFPMLTKQLAKMTSWVKWASNGL